MTEAFTGTWVLQAPQGVDQSHVHRARKLVGELELRREQSGLQVLRRTVQQPDGTVIDARLFAGQVRVTISEPAPLHQRINLSLFGLWIPRGFVVRAAWPDAPHGVGLPVVPLADTTADDPANLDPGPTRDRWTAGGPMQQVLLTRDTNAGYPTGPREIMPLLYADVGPSVPKEIAAALQARPWAGEWQAYRMAFTSYAAVYADESTGLSRDLVAAVNAARAAEGVTPWPDLPEYVHQTQAGTSECMAWPKGLYRPAQITSYVMAANGSTAATFEGYPATYQTEPERLTKDGYGAQVWGMYRPPGWDWSREEVVGAGELRSGGGSAAANVAAWLADGDTRAVLLADYGKSPWIDAGNRNGFMAVSIEHRRQWLQAGNGVWQGTGLAPLSWGTFKSMKLYWETFPVQYDPASEQLVAAVVNRDDDSRPVFTLDGDCWLAYYTSTAATSDGEQPSMGRHLYMYGRAIALAPRGGLIWAAGMMATAAGWRLIALVHHEADQPADWHEGLTRYLRVWWVDVPADGLPARADRVICGEAVDDPYAWKGGQLIDLGRVPTPPTPAWTTTDVNSLKYDSVWRFSPDGSRAACLRDFMSFDQLTQSARDTYDGSNESVVWGGFPIGVELVFSIASNGELLTGVQWQPWAASADRAATTMPGLVPYADAAITEHAPTPMAVDYAANGSLVYAFTGAFSYVPAGSLLSVAIEYAGTGTIATAWPSDMGNLALLSSSARLPELDFAWNSQPQVLSVLDAVFVTEGSHPAWRFPSDYAGGGEQVNPTYVPGKQAPDAGAVLGVHVVRRGVQLDLRWFLGPGTTVWQNGDFCSVHITRNPLSGAAIVQADYVLYRGDWVLGYQVAPQPNLGLFVLASPPASGGACHGKPSVADLRGAHAMALDEFQSMGGNAFASFPLPDAVRGGWLIEALAV